MSSTYSSHAAQVASEFLEAAWPSGQQDDMPPVWVQVLNVAEEAGEFVGAFRRFTGHARRVGHFNEVQAELADTVISAYVVAQRLGIDLDEAIWDKAEIIMSRGFRDPRPGEQAA